MNKRFRHHKYTYCKPFQTPNHKWELVGPAGAIHFHVSMTPGYDPSAGLEYHHTEASRYRRDDAPDHLTCWLTGGRCWHDGTSLYATETVWPRVESLLERGDHEAVFRLLEHEYDTHFVEEVPTTMDVLRELVAPDGGPRA